MITTKLYCVKDWHLLQQPVEIGQEKRQHGSTPTRVSDEESCARACERNYEDQVLPKNENPQKLSRPNIDVVDETTI